MITSLYLQSKEGNLQEIEDAMGKILEDFDMDIGRKMNLTNQLANIQVMELKSLLLNKITIINRLHNGFRFEVLYPVDDLIIPKMDLVRALGILLDNAMEEVSGNGGRYQPDDIEGGKAADFCGETTACTMKSAWRSCIERAIRPKERAEGSGSAATES